MSKGLVKTRNVSSAKQVSDGLLIPMSDGLFIPKPVWVLQIIGGTIGLLVGPTDHWFVNIWIGAVLSMPIGLAICVFSNRSFLKTREFLLGVGTFVGCCLGFLFFIMKDEAIDRFRLVEASSISDITIYEDESGGKPVAVIKDPDLIVEFVNSCKDIKGDASRSAKLSEDWYLVINWGTEPIEMSINCLEKGENKIQGVFVKVETNSISYYSEFTSQGMKTWFDKIRRLYDF